MLDTARRLLAAALVALAVTGLVPLLPLAFGFYAADVTNAASGTYYPTTTATPFFSCAQFQTPTVRLDDKRTYNNIRIFRCTNNWGTAITLTWDLPQPNGSNITGVGGSATVPAGAQNYCVAVSLRTGNAASLRDVVFRGTIDQTDLRAEIQFPVQLVVQNGSSPTQC